MKEGTTMAISLPDARKLSDEVLEALRLRALRGRELGFTEADLADLLGVSREAVCRWWRDFLDAGTAGLPGRRSGRPPGSGRLLSPGQGDHTRYLIDHHAPEELGIASPLWNRRAVRDLIRQQCGVDLAVRTVGKYLRRWGYTAKRPQRHSRDQVPEEVREWVEETYPAVEKRAEEEGAKIFWCDETGSEADHHPGRGYARKGERATMEVPRPHIRMNQISAISNTGAVRFMTYARTMNAALFIAFLGRLLRSTTGKLFLIADRLRAHGTAAVDEWVAAHHDRIELLYLARRAPERNVVEYLNNDLKGRINAEGLPGSKGELRSRIQRFMRGLLHLPEHVKSYFQHPCVQYASIH
jgi:transposase